MKNNVLATSTSALDIFKLSVSILGVWGILILSIANIHLNPFIVVGVCTIPLIALPTAMYYRYTSFIAPLCFAMHGIFAIILAITLFFRSQHIDKKQVIFPIFLILLELFSTITLIVDSIKVVDIVIYFAYLCIFFHFLFYNTTQQQNVDFLRFFSIGLFISLIIIYANIFTSMKTIDLIEGTIRGGATMGSDENETLSESYIAMNANSIAYYALTLLSSLLLGAKNIGLPKFFVGIACIIAIAGGILTFSRTFIILAACLAILFFLQLKNRYKVVFIIVTSIITLMILQNNNQVSDMIFSAFENRFENDNIETAGDRTLLFKDYNNFFIENPRYWLIGTGAIHYKDVCNLNNSVHNGIQQVYVCHGICGLIAFLCVIWMFCKKYHHRGTRFVQYLPLFAIFTFSQALQFLNPHFLMLPFLCIAYAIKLNISNSDETLYNHS